MYVKSEYKATYYSNQGNKNLQKNDIIIAGDFYICLMKCTDKAYSLCFLNTT